MERITVNLDDLVIGPHHLLPAQFDAIKASIAKKGLRDVPKVVKHNSIDGLYSVSKGKDTVIVHACNELNIREIDVDLLM